MTWYDSNSGPDRHKASEFAAERLLSCQLRYVCRASRLRAVVDDHHLGVYCAWMFAAPPRRLVSFAVTFLVTRSLRVSNAHAAAAPVPALRSTHDDAAHSAAVPPWVGTPDYAAAPIAALDSGVSESPCQAATCLSGCCNTGSCVSSARHVSLGHGHVVATPDC